MDTSGEVFKNLQSGPSYCLVQKISDLFQELLE